MGHSVIDTSLYFPDIEVLVVAFLTTRAELDGVSVGVTLPSGFDGGQRAVVINRLGGAFLSDDLLDDATAPIDSYGGDKPAAHAVANAVRGCAAADDVDPPRRRCGGERSAGKPGPVLVAGPEARRREPLRDALPVGRPRPARPNVSRRVSWLGSTPARSGSPPSRTSTGCPWTASRSRRTDMGATYTYLVADLRSGAIYVDRDGDLLWGGTVWTSRYSGANAVLELGAADLLSYSEHRLVLDPANPTEPVPLSGDQITVARDLVAGTASSGVPRTITYTPEDLKPVADALRDLANADDGFDFAFDVRYSPSGVPERFLRIGFPRIGQPGTPHVWEYGANLIDFTWPPTRRAWRPGWSRRVVRRSRVKGELAARRRPVVLPELTVRADLDPLVGSYSVGDDARIVIDDPFFPGEQLDSTVRVIGLEVTPGDDAGQEQVKLTVAPLQGQA